MWASSACWTSDVEPGPVVVAGDVGVFCLGCLPLGSLWCLMLWFLRNVARNSPTCISNIEITSLEFCGFLDTYEKLGYPNYVRLLVDGAPKANSCVRSSSHDTVHDPRDASTTTPTPHNAKSRKTGRSSAISQSMWPRRSDGSRRVREPSRRATALTRSWPSRRSREDRLAESASGRGGGIGRPPPRFHFLCALAYTNWTVSTQDDEVSL